MTDIVAVCARLTTLFTETLNLEVPANDVDLFESGILDSLTFVQLLFHLEGAFGITTTVNDLDPGNFRTIDCIAEFVVGRLAATQVNSKWATPLKARVG